ncbi:MAG TPA: chemotaxis protein CheB [Luteimonas sp.]|nr:chemotaxis protein CheB [Luteimonas sp.]
MQQKPAPTAGEKHNAGDSGDANAMSALAEKGPAPSHAPRHPLIVGIGASAGGLEAFKSFFAHMPTDSDMAFVLVQHLAPQHVSLLTELIGRSTVMPVLEAADGERVQARHVYVIPPDATLTIADSVLQVSKPAPPRQHRWPINTFFTSLAEDQGDCAVCVVLSGTGSDGARGLRAVKQHGGLTLAQAGFDHVAMTGMPASAVATGLVDHILPVEEMPARLIAHQQHLQITHDKKGPDGARQDLAAHLQTICGLLRAQVGHDFSQYKEKTLVRRIQRRMQVVQADTVPDYIAHLRKHAEEHEQLFREMLIGVTEFFRDPLAFEALQHHAIPTLLAGKSAADTLRMWVPGCATGEEAYSIAIALQEGMGGKRGGPKVQIFATDIDDSAISAARAGRYKQPLIGISPERQERWFTQEGDDFCVVKPIREMCVFSPHSAIKDPPFSRLDLVSCRNLLIYLNTDLQERLVRTFHYALRPGGFLLLGPSESLARNVALFSALDKKHRLYARRDGSGTGGMPGVPANRAGSDFSATVHAPAGPIRAGAEDLIDLAARRAVEKYSPAYVVIDDNHDILRFAGDTGRYLGPSSGAASLNLFALLHKGLRGAARAVVHQAFAEGKLVVQDGLSVLVDGHRQPLRLIAEPLPQADGAVRKLCVVAFAELQQPPATAARDGGDSAADTARVQLLQRELEATQIQLQTALEQQELNNEELKSTNEEYQSVNEELQSSNEELETSKEEMQSINEELQTVNAEMHSKNEALARLNSDLANLLESTQIATLFLDNQLHIRSYTPVMTDLFHLRVGDRGRPITEISARVNYPELAQDVKQVLRTLGMVERLLQGADGGPAFLMRMRPYRTVDDMIDGVVLTFVDISERRQYEVERGLLAAIVDSSTEIIIGHTLGGTITSWNASAERILGYQAPRVMGRSLSLLLPAGSDDQTSELLKSCKQSQPAELEMTWLRLDGSTVEVAITCSPVRDIAGHVIAGSVIARDITERTQAERHVELMLAELNHRVKNTLASVQAIALQTVANSPTLEAFRDTFLARLLALSNTHNLLANDVWKGADLREIVLSELAPYQRDGQSRIELTGDALQLTPKIALALSMALHELATNAGKYGALSVPQGQVAVSWETRRKQDRPWLHLLWAEHNGPLVTPPSRRGFGSRLLNEGLAYELEGTAALEFEPTGVTCRIDFPLLEIENLS